MVNASEWLVEIGANTGSAPIVLRYSSCGFVSKPSDDPANVHYAPRIADAGRFARHLFGPGRTMGEGQYELGELSFANADGALDVLLDYAVDGKDVVLRRLANRRGSLASSVPVLRASVEQLDGERGSELIRLRFYDRRRVIDKPIQTNRYAGTTTAGGQGTADGPPDLKDVLKPLVFGFVRHMSPVLVNPFDLILQVNDGPIEHVQLYDGGVALFNDGDSSSLADLIAAPINPGHYRTCKALGLVRPGGSERGRAFLVWTADVTEGADGQRNAAALIERMLARLGMAGPADLDLASFASLAASAPAELGLYLESETSGLAAIQQVLESIGGFMVPDAQGRFAVGRLTGPAVPSLTIRQRDILGESFGVIANPDTDGNVPAHELKLLWGKHYRVLSDNEVGGCVTQYEPDRAAGLRLEHREERVEDPAVKQRHVLAAGLDVQSLFRFQADAAAEAARRFALYSTNRLVCRVTVIRELAEQIQLNDTVWLEPDLTIAARAMVVIGEERDHGQEVSTLTLWG